MHWLRIRRGCGRASTKGPSPRRPRSIYFALALILLLLLIPIISTIWTANHADASQPGAFNLPRLRNATALYGPSSGTLRPPPALRRATARPPAPPPVRGPAGNFQAWRVMPRNGLDALCFHRA